MEYIARTKENSFETQSLKTHGEEVAALATVFAPSYLKSAAYIGGLIFDEIQKLPVPLLLPCLQAIAFLCHNCGSISFLLSAVMPDIQPLFDEYVKTGLDIRDMVPDKSLFPEFYNCRYKYIEIDSGSDLIQCAKGKKSFLIITNGKRGALKMYFEYLKQKNTQVYYLSTYQTANDRQKAMEEIREKLKIPGKSKSLQFPRR